MRRSQRRRLDPARLDGAAFATPAPGQSVSRQARFETVPFHTTEDEPRELNLKHLLPGSTVPGEGPVLLIGGTSVRADIFSPPTEDTLPEFLARAGYDVWILNWRASIDFAPSEYHLDDAAVYDHPAAVRTVLERTGAETLKAVVHCQGSTSFMMSIVSGLLPEVTTVVSNSVALHPQLTSLSFLKLPLAVATFGKVMPYFNPQWGLHAPGFWPKVFDWAVRATHHECNNAVCKHSSFTYGSAFPTLWSHENLDEATHEWIKGEFGFVPVTFFAQMAECAAAGHLVTMGNYPDVLPSDLFAQEPQTDARFAFMTGDQNNTFLPSGMAKTFDYFERIAPGRHVFQQMHGYGHLDVFLGRHAARDVFPFILDELNRG
ncbi:hypothetical protein ABIC28_003236 [Rhodococcus sp. PvR044]|jgi:hypothetical protein|uniref:hypothetical protein n=1 Tax=Rhodococcus TaxID=1827 RepID=UPI0022B41E29|nr:hypothetical protein [Rhodococcus maanshanensis]MCZ4554954.1 hypothetical protein [Rhodococcus maanshanensis]